jgi:hypothetical protein
MTNMSFLVKLFAITLYPMNLQPILAWYFVVDGSPQKQGMNIPSQMDTIQ